MATIYSGFTNKGLLEEFEAIINDAARGYDFSREKLNALREEILWRLSATVEAVSIEI